MKTLEEYHLKYPGRPGDTPEKFARYEEFRGKNPCPSMFEGYNHWYARLAAHMEVEITPVSGPIFPLDTGEKPERIAAMPDNHTADPSQFKIHPAMAALPAQDPYGRIVDLPISESSPLIAVIPQALRDIAANLASQDSRATNNPQFLVQKKVRQTALDLNYCDDYVWLDCYNDHREVTDFEQIQRLDELEQKYPLTKDEEAELNDYLKTGYTDRWETVQPFFTEVEADRYIAANKHRHDGELRTYVEWGGRNPEWMAVRNFLLSLNPSAPNAPTTPSTTP